MDINRGTQDKEEVNNVQEDERRRKKDLNTQFLESVNIGDLNKVKELLKLGADINAVGYPLEDHGKRYSSLILAAEKGHLELFEILLCTPSVNINQKDYYGFTALHKASDSGEEKMVELLIGKEGINLNEQDTKFGFTPLYLASWGGYTKVVKKLLGEPGIWVNVKDKNGQTALHKSSSSGHTEVVKILLSTPGILVNEHDSFNSHTPLHLAADFRHSDTVEVLLSHPDVNVNVKDKYGQTPLHTSAYYGNLKVVEMLLNAGIDVNEKTRDGFTAIQWASKQGHVKVVELIVNHIKNVKTSSLNVRSQRSKVDNLNQSIKSLGIFSENQGSSSKENDLNEQLLSAAQNGHIEKVEKLLKRTEINVNCIDQNGNTPLHLATEKGHLEVVNELLKISNIDVNAKNKDESKLVYPVHMGDNPMRGNLKVGKTALHLAVIGGNVALVKILVNNSKVDVNAKDKYGISPLCIAVKENKLEITEILLNHSAIDVNVIDVCNDHFSLLHIVSEKGNTEMAKALLKHPKINVNLKDKWDICTPLHLAVRSNNLEIVEAILNNQKVDVNATCKYDNTPLHDAAKKGYSDILNCLLNSRANMNSKNISGKTPFNLAIENKHTLCINLLNMYPKIFNLI